MRSNSCFTGSSVRRRKAVSPWGVMRRPVDARFGDAAEREREHAENGEQKKTTDRKHHPVFIGRSSGKL